MIVEVEVQRVVMMVQKEE